MLSLAYFLAQLDTTPLPQSAADENLFPKVINIALGMLGVISFLIIVIAGIRYIISRGEPQAISNAKNTIMYAVIGLVIAISATVIVHFVVGRL